MPDSREEGSKKIEREDIPNELAANRTSMAFERTAMSAHRTLQAVMKTSLSLIGFGFTIFKFFTALSDDFLTHGFPEDAAHNFGLAMIVLGILILVLGIFDHYFAMKALRIRKHRLVELGIQHSDMPNRIASSMAIALALLFLGVLAIADILFGMI